MWDSFFCLLPALLLLLTTALLHRSPVVRALLQSTSRWAIWILWWGTCWVLELPAPASQDDWTEGRQDAAGAGAQLKLVCKPTALAQHLLLHCRTLLRPELATWPWGDPHLQTLSSLLWSTEGAAGEGKVQFTRDNLLLSDGGIVALDWAVGLRVKSEQHPGTGRGSLSSRGTGSSSSCSGRPPILLLVPNCLGVVTPHLRHLCSLALRQGYKPVVFHRRGHGGCPLTTPRYQEFSDPGDLAQAVAYLHGHHPSTTLLAVSEGSGSGLLLSYLGERGSSSYLTAAVCISPVLHGRLWFEMPLPSLYHWGAVFHRKLQISRYASALSSVMDVGRLLSCRHFRDIEKLMFCTTQKPSAPPDTTSGEGQTRTEALTKSWEAYWERNEPLRDADEVAVPVLCLCSADDPLVPPAATLPTALFRSSPYFLLALTARGGHLGFFSQVGTGSGNNGNGGSGISPSADTVLSWSHVALLEYFQVTIDFLKGEERRRKSSGRRWPQGQEAVSVGGQGPGWRHRTGTMLARRRRPVLGMRRERHLTHQPAQSDLTEDLFIWNRSYTR